MTVMGVNDARATATAVFPEPVGPTMTGVRGRGWGLGAGEPSFKLFLGKLDHRRPAVDVMHRQRGREQADDQLPHLLSVELMPGFDRGTTGIGGRKPLEAILPATKATAGEVGDELLEAARCLKAGMRVRRGMHYDASPRKRLDLVADALQELAMRINRIELGRREIERQRQKQTLCRRAIAAQLMHHVFVQHALMRRVLVDD